MVTSAPMPPKIFLLIIHKLFILFLIDAYSELIMNFTDRLLRSNEEIGSLNNKISSLHKELFAAKNEIESLTKEIEASKIHSIKSPTKRKDALSSKILDFIEGHAQTEINAKLIMLSLDIPGESLGTVYAHLYHFCKRGILRRVRTGVYIKTATS